MLEYKSITSNRLYLGLEINVFIQKKLGFRVNKILYSLKKQVALLERI